MANFARKFEVFVRILLLFAFIASASAPAGVNAQSLPPGNDSRAAECVNDLRHEN